MSSGLVVVGLCLLRLFCLLLEFVLSFSFRFEGPHLIGKKRCTRDCKYKF